MSPAQRPWREREGAAAGVCSGPSRLHGEIKLQLCSELALKAMGRCSVFAFQLVPWFNGTTFRRAINNTAEVVFGAYPLPCPVLAFGNPCNNGERLSSHVTGHFWTVTFETVLKRSPHDSLSPRRSGRSASCLVEISAALLNPFLLVCVSVPRRTAERHPSYKTLDVLGDSNFL